jgi:catechol 2,3-dioxygenase-like lactoylglutathione lyase family enzyme
MQAAEKTQSLAPEVQRMSASETAALGGLVPLARVADMKRSIEFYRLLGFELIGKYDPEGQLKWVHLRSGGAELMLSLAEQPVNATAQTVLFYLYVPGVARFREELAGRGVNVGELQYFFFAKDGEFRIVDPDGYVLLIGQASA